MIFFFIYSTLNYANKNKNYVRTARTEKSELKYGKETSYKMNEQYLLSMFLFCTIWRNIKCEYTQKTKSLSISGPRLKLWIKERKIYMGCLDPCLRLEFLFCWFVKKIAWIRVFVYVKQTDHEIISCRMTRDPLNCEFCGLRQMECKQ